MLESNRRKTPRINYPCQLTMWVAQGVYDTVLAQTTNIGMGGLCVHLNQGIAPGMKVDIQIGFPDMTGTFKCKGAVVRCQQESQKIYNIGIQFEPLSELNHIFLDKKISELINLEKKSEQP